MKKFDISHEYDVDLFSGSVYDSKSETLSQICAFLNPLRLKAANKIGVKSEMKLSSYYILYYYLVELSCALMDYCEAEKNEEKALSLVPLFLSKLFTFKDFQKIVSNYGVVPISAMPDAAHHHKNDAVYVLENRLRLGVSQLVSGAATKEEILTDVVGILNDGFGIPPEQFSFAFINVKDELEKLEFLTPTEFFENYCETDLDSYTVCDASKALAAEQIQDGEEVVICADTRHQRSQMLGILDTDFIDDEDMFGTACSLSKEEKLRLKIIKPTAYLALDGVAFDDNGSPVRFKAQDSHGSDTGADGHYTMSAKWFDEYALSMIIGKKYLS